MSSTSARSTRNTAPIGFEPLETRALLSNVSWDGGGGDLLWSNPLNWSTNQLPGENDDVTINVAGTPTIQFTSAAGAVHVRSIQSQESLSISGGTLTPSNSASFLNSASLLLQAGRMEGGQWNIATGTFRASGGTIAGCLVSAVLVIDQGNADVTFEGETTFATILLKAQGGVVHFGSGFTLRSSLIADAGGHPGTLMYLRAEASIVNEVTITAQAGARLELQAPWVVNAGWMTVADASSTIALSQGQVVNHGSMRTFGGSLRITAKSFRNEADGWMNAELGSEIAFNPEQTWINTGMIVADSSIMTFAGDWPASNIDRAVFLHHSGMLVIQDGVVDNSGHTLRFDGEFRSWTLFGEIRGGTVEIGPGRPLFVSLGTFRDVQIQDELAMQDGSQLTLAGSTRFPQVVLSGQSSVIRFADGYVLRDRILIKTIQGDMFGSRGLEPEGHLEIATTGSLVVTDFAGGSKIGSAASVVVNHGLIEVAAGMLLEVNGSFKFAADGVLRLHERGLNLSDASHLDVNGAVELGGRLEVVSDGYTPQLGDVLPLTYGGVLSGRFDTLSLPAPPDAASQVAIRYSAGGFEMVTTSLIDLNLDGTVDLQDFFLFFNKWDAVDSSLDLNHDGSVDLGDYFLFFNLWDQG